MTVVVPESIDEESHKQEEEPKLLVVVVEPLLLLPPLENTNDALSDKGMTITGRLKRDRKCCKRR